MWMRLCVLVLPLLLLMGSAAHARPDTLALYVEAVMSNNTERLETLLADNYLRIGPGGHQQDKENFIENIKSGKMIVDRMTISDAVTTHYGNATLITGNAVFRGKFDPPMPSGPMRFSIVLEKRDKGEEKVILMQMTPIKKISPRKGKAKKAKDAPE